jgi:hypothetical protein
VEDFVDGESKRCGDAESQIERGVVTFVFEGVYRISRDPNEGAEMALRPPALSSEGPQAALQGAEPLIIGVRRPKTPQIIG